MKTTLWALLHIISLPVSNAEEPQLFREYSFTAATLAEAVNHFVALGEEPAVRELTALAPDYSSRREDKKQTFQLCERVGWVCRILFQPKGKEPLRAPGYGGLSLPHLTMPQSSWPLYPVATSGNSFFVLSEGYSLIGKAEDPKMYLAYCRAKGTFRKEPVAVPTRDQARKDVALLRESAAWKAIKWKDRFNQGNSYDLSENKQWRFLEAQADAIR